MTDAEQPIAEADPGLAGWEHPLARLRRALDEDELQLYCQPILSMQAQGARFPMAEVLVRLREEEQSMLPPGDFLPVFEHYQMLADLDCWVVRKTVEWIARARPRSIPAYCVNVSSQSLGDASRLPRFAAEVLAKHGVSPSALCMEVDEADTLERAGIAARFAQEVRSVGCRVAIDGFARRSVSFAPLKSLQPDFVKVDGAVVRKIAASPVARLKLQAIVRVGAITGIGIIAECVEEPPVIADLRKMSVGFAQGFGIAEPRPIETGAFAPY